MAEVGYYIVPPHMANPLPINDPAESPAVPQKACCGSATRIAVLGTIIAGVLGIAFTITWYAGLRNRFQPVNFGVVEPGKIYRSGQISQHIVKQTLRDNHIGLIINLSAEDTPDAHAEESAAKALGVEEVRRGLGGDGLGDPNVYPKALADIVRANREGKAVLVHCQSGAQRTGGIIATYRILVEGESPDEAFAEMRRYGHDPKHNPLLIPFIREHLAEWKAQFEQYENSASAAASVQHGS